MPEDDPGQGAQDERDAEELRQAARKPAGADGDIDTGEEFKGGNVPYDRYKAKTDAQIADRRAREAAEARLAELEAAEDKRKRAAMTEADRTKAERDEATTKAEAAEARAARAERENVLYRAAVKLGFADPDDAAVYLGADDSVKDADSAAEALEDLLERKPHLAAGDGATRPRSIGAPRRDREPEGGGDRRPTARRLGASDAELDQDATDAELGREIGEGLGFLRRGGRRA